MGWLIRGWTVEEAQMLFDRLVEEQVMPNLRPEILSRLDQHHDHGHLVALVSGTFAPCLEMIAQRLRRAPRDRHSTEVREGRYTGRILPPLCQGAGKVQRVQGLSRRSGTVHRLGEQLCLRG